MLPGATSEHLLPSKCVLQVGLQPVLLALSPAMNAEGSRATLVGCAGIWASSRLRAAVLLYLLLCEQVWETKRESALSGLSSSGQSQDSPPQ